VRNENHVIICGFGRLGQNLARLLELEQIKYIALDLDPDRVKEASEAGNSVVYGDAQSANTLQAAGIMRAKSVVITFSGTANAVRLIHQIEQLRPGIPVLVRAADDSDLELLQAAGATEVIPEQIEGSLMLASHVLLVSGVPMRRVVRRITEAREARYSLLRGYFRSIEDEDISTADAIRLHSVRLVNGAAGIGQALTILNECDVQVQTIRRSENATGGYKQFQPLTDEVLQADDVLVLMGTSRAIEKAERLLI
jgi:CPA2 family monovalent cation:H+ antiporter-2